MNFINTLISDVALAYATLPPTPRLWRTSPEGSVGAGAPVHLSIGLSISKALSYKSSSIWRLLSFAQNLLRLPLTPSGSRFAICIEGFIETLLTSPTLPAYSTISATKKIINSVSGKLACSQQKSLIRAQYALSMVIFIIGLALSSELIAASKETFVIVVPSYNNEKWTERVLESLVHQKTTQPYRIICVNDCSKDRTGQIMDEFARKHNLSEPFLKIIHNPVRKGALANIYNTVHEQCTDDEIVVLVDGDDFLNSRLVLQRLEHEYANPDIWLTYGQYVFYPSGRWGVCYEITREDLEARRVRELTYYCAQHLRTFKAKLFKKIKKEHLILDGEFFAMNADMATMVPMLEMCAPKDATSPMHCKFIPDILYIYNYINPISDFRVNNGLQLELEKVIRAIKPYEPVETL